jgi:hypothetical protein
VYCVGRSQLRRSHGWFSEGVASDTQTLLEVVEAPGAVERVSKDRWGSEVGMIDDDARSKP